MYSTVLSKILKIKKKNTGTLWAFSGENDKTTGNYLDWHCCKQKSKKNSDFPICVKTRSHSKGKVGSRSGSASYRCRFKSSVVDLQHFDEDLDADPDSTYHPDAEPDTDLSFQIKAQTLEKVLK